MQKGTLCIQADYFASRTKSRVDTHHPFLSQRRGQQQLTEVFCEYPNSFFISLFLAECGKLGFDGRFQQALVGIGESFFHLVCTFIVGPNEQPLQAFVAHIFIFRENGYFQDTFRFSPTKSQQAVGRTFLQGLTEIKVVAVLGRSFFCFFSFDHF